MGSSSRRDATPTPVHRAVFATRFANTFGSRPGLSRRREAALVSQRTGYRLRSPRRDLSPLELDALSRASLDSPHLGNHPR
jgi:hypothetical protein